MQKTKARRNWAIRYRNRSNMAATSYRADAEPPTVAATVAATSVAVGEADTAAVGSWRRAEEGSLVAAMTKHRHGR